MHMYSRIIPLSTVSHIPVSLFLSPTKGGGEILEFLTEYNGIIEFSFFLSLKVHCFIVRMSTLTIGDPLLVRISMLRESHSLFVEIILIHVIIQYFRFRL